MPYKDPKKQKDYQNKWMRKRREDWLQKNGPCSRCGSTKNLVPHHRDPEKKESHRIWSWSKEKREKELRKCDVLCVTCHKAVHKEIREKNRRHGCHNTYQLGCRCSECVKGEGKYRKGILKANGDPIQREV